MSKRPFLIVVVLLIFLIISSGFTIKNNSKSSSPVLPTFKYTNGMEIGYLNTDNRNEADHLIMEPYSVSFNNSIPICGIKEYITYGDDDLSWSCEITESSGGWAFDLYEENDGTSGSSGYISANVLVLDKDYFELIDKAEFWIFSDYSQLRRNDSEHVWKLDEPAHDWDFYVPEGAIPLVTINRYDANGDDDFSFMTAFDITNSSLYLDGKNGNDGSYVYGNIYILRGRTHPDFGSDFVGKIEENGWFFSGNYTTGLGESVDIYLQQDFWDDANTYTFNSIFSIWSDDKDFEISTSSDVWSDRVTAYIWRNRGNEDSKVGVQVAVLQTFPPD